MFNNELTNIEKRALLITLANLSKKTTITIYTDIYNKKLYKRVKIGKPLSKTSIHFNIDNYFKCDNILKSLLIDVFDEYNFIPVGSNENLDILHNFSLLCNGITRLIKEDLQFSITPIKTDSTSLISRLQKTSDYYTLTLLRNINMSKSEKTCLVIVRQIIDNILSGIVFNDGVELLDFINGTRIIQDLLCLNATLYDENTYYHFYQQSS